MILEEFPPFNNQDKKTSTDRPIVFIFPQLRLKMLCQFCQHFILPYQEIVRIFEAFSKRNKEKTKRSLKNITTAICIKIKYTTYCK